MLLRTSKCTKSHFWPGSDWTCCRAYSALNWIGWDLGTGMGEKEGGKRERLVKPKMFKPSSARACICQWYTFEFTYWQWLDCVCFCSLRIGLCSDCVAGVMPQLVGPTTYQPSVRILKRDRAADAALSMNQSVYVMTINVLKYLFRN